MNRTIPAITAAISLIATALFVTCSDNKPTGPPKNRAPVAHAGSPQQADISSQVFLDASKSRDPDGDPITYAWQQTSGISVTLDDSTLVSPHFQSPNSEGVITFMLTVRDGRGGTGTDDTIVIVVSSTQPPSANAGADQVVGVNSTVTLRGSGSDPYGGPVSFSWRQYTGTPVVSLSAPDVAEPMFTAPAIPTTLGFELTVTDEGNRSTLDSVTVNVETAPPSVGPTLYVLNSNSVSAWQTPQLVNGSVAPDFHILPDNAQFATPQDIAVDSRGALLVANRGSSVTIFDQGNQDGAVSPDRVVTGAQSGLEGPVSLAIGPAKDILFVGDSRQHSVISFDGVSRADFDGDVSLSRMFWIQNYDLQPGPTSYDENRDMLYVLDTTLNQILVYHAASTLNGASSWNRTIKYVSSASKLTGLFVDSANDRIYVVSRNNREIYVWDNASMLTISDGVPSRTFIAGDAPVDIVVDASNRGYVLDNNDAILSFDNVDAATGNPAPTRTISGNDTQLSSPVALYMYE